MKFNIPIVSVRSLVESESLKGSQDEPGEEMVWKEIDLKRWEW